MAKYNTFLVLTTKGKPILVTSSARKARQHLQVGARVEVWSENRKKEIIYNRTRYVLDKYVTAEKEYIRAKQETAERRNRKRKKHENR